MSSYPSLDRDWASELARSPDSEVARVSDDEVAGVLAPRLNPGGAGDLRVLRWSAPNRGRGLNLTESVFVA